MQQYLDLVRDVLQNGVRKPTRAHLASTGENIDAVSVFGRQVRHDLSKGFPLVTTKKVNFPSVVHELLWFLRGDTNVKYLEDNGVKIWSEWADSSGDLGPVYGAQWRRWRHEYKGDVSHTDQVEYLVSGVRAVLRDPTHSVGRRLILSAWNVGELWDMALWPCHCLAQFNVTNGKLSCHLHQRSADVFLGAPFNIASYALLTHIIAKLTGLEAGELIHSIGDAHIYVNHLEQVEKQLARRPLPLPSLRIETTAHWPWDVQFDEIILQDYVHHGFLKGEVAI